MHISRQSSRFYAHMFFFLTKLCLSSTNEQPANGLELWKAFARYIWNGGVNWKFNWDLNLTTFLTAIFFLCYNGLRISLLVKTKKLEMLEVASKIPPAFSFTEPVFSKWNFLAWESIYHGVRYGFGLYILCVLFHLVAFLLNHWIDLSPAH